MAAALLAEIPAGIGEVIQGIDVLGTELGIGNVASNSIIAEASNEAKKLINPAVDTIFGTGTAQNFENQISNGYSTLQEFFADTANGDALGTHTRQRQRDALSHPLTQDENNRLNALLAQRWIKEQQAGGCVCDATSKPVSSILQGPSYQQAPPEIVGSSIDVAQDIMSNGQYMPTAGVNIVIAQPPSRAPSLPVVQTIIPPIPQQALTRQDGRDLGYFIVASTFDTADNGSDTGVQTLMEKPQLYQMAKSYTEFLHSKNIQGIDYYTVKDTYNGINIDTSSAFVSDTGHYSVPDEVGNLQVYTGSSAPPDSSNLWLAANGFIPPIHGIWVGPKSPNNGLPVDLLDTYAMMHDIDYQEGWFDQIGDFKLISRIENNVSRMGYLESAVAKFTIKWFSTVGYALAQIKGGLQNPTKPNSQNGMQDIYEFISAKQEQKTLPVVPSAISVDIGKEDFYLTTPLDAMSRVEFYEGVTEAVAEQFQLKCPYSAQNVSLLNSLLANLQVVSLNG